MAGNHEGVEGMGLKGLVQIFGADFHGEGAFRIFEISGYDDCTVVGGDERYRHKVAVRGPG